MVKMVPVDRRSHAGKALRQGAGYGFAADQTLVPITAAEFATAAIAMPIAFIEHSKRYLPVAVTSPIQGRNLFISPTGQWLGTYIPAALRSYPFRLGMAEGSTVVSLWIDEDSGAVVDVDKRYRLGSSRKTAPRVLPLRVRWNSSRELKRTGP